MLQETTLTRKEQIFTIATQLFASRGYKATSLRDLAAELGIEAPSLYSYINGKEELLRDIILPMAHEFIRSIHEIEGFPGSPSERLEKLMDSHIRIVLKNPAASSVFWSDHKSLTGDARDSFYNMRDEYERIFGAIIQEGVESCDFEIEDIKVTSMTILTALNNIWHWYDPEYTTKEDLIRQITSTFMHGIKSRNQ